MVTPMGDTHVQTVWSTYTYILSELVKLANYYKHKSSIVTAGDQLIEHEGDAVYICVTWCSYSNFRKTPLTLSGHVRLSWSNEGDEGEEQLG